MKEKEESADLPLIQVGHLDDPTAITVQVSLPAAVWERLTADLRDFDRMTFDRPELPDLSLPERIWQFLDMELLSWEASVTDYPERKEVEFDDLDDGLPF
ncbi:hypothetical protein V5740_03315 [Croceibacterium sp. TMG7-5b_MA50]|uniref:hypothetical protein n=1 Tax=Croceibacterium sp. TMG7-5b_MA50 TaxID=3121290 RepID=UPI00322145AD